LGLIFFIAGASLAFFLGESFLVFGAGVLLAFGGFVMAICSVTEASFRGDPQPFSAEYYK
jgi:hypothetical protein